jgi:hypothetical protein
MKNNVNFPSPVPTYAEVEAAWAAFSESLPLARSGSRSSIATKNANKAVFAQKLQRMATYVNLTAMGDAAVLLTSGFVLEKENGAHVEPETPQDILVMNGLNSGDMMIGVGIAVGAKSFIFQYTTDPVTEKSVWVSEGSTLKRHTFRNLVPGSRLWFRVIAVGIGAQQRISKAIEAIVV